VWEANTRASKGGYRVEYSSDGSRWTQVSHPVYEYGESSDYVSFDAVTARNIRVYCTNGSNSKYRPKVYEFRTFESAGSEFTPVITYASGTVTPGGDDTPSQAETSSQADVSSQENMSSQTDVSSSETVASDETATSDPASDTNTSGEPAPDETTVGASSAVSDGGDGSEEGSGLWLYIIIGAAAVAIAGAAAGITVHNGKSKNKTNKIS